jgi:uncharacterized membrane protein
VSAETVLVITLDHAERAPEAIGALTGLAADGALELRAAAVVRRSADGRISIGDEVGDVDTAGTFAERFPRLATLLLALAGPLDTVLFGNSLMVLTGALAEPSPDEVALEHLARAVAPGRTAVVAEVVESDPAVVDRALADLSVRVARRPLVELEAELDAAREAMDAAGEAARRVLRDTHPARG